MIIAHSLYVFVMHFYSILQLLHKVLLVFSIIDRSKISNTYVNNTSCMGFISRKIMATDHSNKLTLKKTLASVQEDHHSIQFQLEDGQCENFPLTTRWPSQPETSQVSIDIQVTLSILTTLHNIRHLGILSYHYYACSREWAALNPTRSPTGEYNLLRFISFL